MKKMRKWKNVAAGSGIAMKCGPDETPRLTWDCAPAYLKGYLGSFFEHQKDAIAGPLTPHDVLKAPFATAADKKRAREIIAASAATLRAMTSSRENAA